MISSSRLYREAAGLKPAGPLKAEKDCRCIMCSGKIEKDDPCAPAGKDLFGSSFNNKLDIHTQGDRVCGDCLALWSKDFLQKYSKSYATRDGLFKLASTDDQARFVMFPPEPPFVAIFSTRQQQHMIWRTPVSYSREVYFVRVDDEVLTVRDKLFREGVSAWKDLVAEMAARGKKGLPTVALSAGQDHSQNGVLRRDVREIALDAGMQAQVETLERLGMGEWWALNAVSRRYLEDTPPEAVKLLAPEA